jgi:hypothetical protein
MRRINWMGIAVLAAITVWTAFLMLVAHHFLRSSETACAMSRASSTRTLWRAHSKSSVVSMQKILGAQASQHVSTQLPEVV